MTEAATLLPRPLALYVSKREDARELVSSLQAAGLKRVAEVTACHATMNAARHWKAGPPRPPAGLVPSLFDVLVGTSASVSE